MNNHQERRRRSKRITRRRKILGAVFGGGKRRNEITVNTRDAFLSISLFLFLVLPCRDSWRRQVPRDQRTAPSQLCPPIPCIFHRFSCGIPPILLSPLRARVFRALDPFFLPSRAPRGF